MDICYCANCRSEGECEFRTGQIPADCIYRNHKSCESCGYYGPITNPAKICSRCAGFAKPIQV